MTTIELLNKICDLLTDNPDALDDMNWHEVTECVECELQERKALYPGVQYDYIMADIKRIEERLDSAQVLGDVFSLLLLISELKGMITVAPNLDYYTAFISQYTYLRAYKRHHSENTVIVIGDSHVNFFSGNEHISLNPMVKDINLCESINSLPFTVLHLGPALAYNCNKTGSFSGFYEKTDFLIKDFFKPGCGIVLSLGEIDIRVHVFKQAEKQKKTVEEIIESVLDEYLIFMNGLKERGFSVFCWGPIASQKDDTPQDPMFPRIGTEIQRNKATAYFNERLEELCLEQGIGFLSIFRELITDEYRTRGEYLSDDNFHLGQKAMELALPVFRKKGLL